MHQRAALAIFITHRTSSRVYSFTMASGSGSTATLVNLNEDLSLSVIRSAVASMVICLVFYLLRLLSRRISRTPLMVSDYTLFGGVIACYVISSVDLWGMSSHRMISNNID